MWSTRSLRKLISLYLWSNLPRPTIPLFSTVGSVLILDSRLFPIVKSLATVLILIHEIIRHSWACTSTLCSVLSYLHIHAFDGIRLLEVCLNSLIPPELHAIIILFLTCSCSCSCSPIFITSRFSAGSSTGPSPLRRDSRFVFGRHTYQLLVIPINRYRRHMK